MIMGLQQVYREVDMKQHRVVAMFFAVLGAGMLVAGCAEPVEDVDYTQPNAIQKSVFDGEWSSHPDAQATSRPDH